MKSLIPLILLFTASIVACSSEEAPAPIAPPAGTSEPPPAPATTEQFAPLTSGSRADGGGMVAGDGDGSRIVAPGAIFTLPGSWIAEPPSSSMRLAQARVPGAAGDGQLTVFYFGAGGGGGLESNLSRWLGQLQIDAGTQPLRESFDSGAFRITWIDVQGTLKPSTMGMGPGEPRPGARLLAAVVEGPQGPWYFKATGPSATMADQREAFLGMLRSATAHG